MSKKFTEYNFHIKAFSPDTIPMEKLADYMLELSKVLGNPEHVHFNKLTSGSTGVSVKVENEVVKDTDYRIKNIKTDSQTKKHWFNINKMLKKDNTSAEFHKELVKIYDFPGVKLITQEIKPFWQENFIIQGKVYSVGGKDNTKHVHILDNEGNSFPCETNEEVAKKISDYLFDTIVTAYGKAKVKRNIEGIWEIQAFKLHDFEPVSSTDLTDTFNSLRNIDTGWHNVEDPYKKLEDLRK
jgi:hypothetical protein